MISDLVANAKIEAAADYTKRGRHHASASTADLLSAWTASFKQWVKSHLSADHLAMRDIGAELFLRGVEIPDAAVDSEVRLACAEMMKTGLRSSGLRSEIQDFVLSRHNKPN